MGIILLNYTSILLLHSTEHFPEYIQPMPRDLLRKILVPDSIKIRGIFKCSTRAHSWLKSSCSFLLSVTPVEWDKSYLKLQLPNAQYKQYAPQPTGQGIQLARSQSVQVKSSTNDFIFWILSSFSS